MIAPERDIASFSTPHSKCNDERENWLDVCFTSVADSVCQAPKTLSSDILRDDKEEEKEEDNFVDKIVYDLESNISSHELSNRITTEAEEKSDTTQLSPLYAKASHSKASISAKENTIRISPREEKDALDIIFETVEEVTCGVKKTTGISDAECSSIPTTKGTRVWNESNRPDQNRAVRFEEGPSLLTRKTWQARERWAFTIVSMIILGLIVAGIVLIARAV